MIRNIKLWFNTKGWLWYLEICYKGIALSTCFWLPAKIIDIVPEESMSKIIYILVIPQHIKTSKPGTFKSKVVHVISLDNGMINLGVSQAIKPQIP